MYEQDGNLGRALSKVKSFSDTNQWCAALLPCEIVALVDAGAQCPYPVGDKEWRGYWVRNLERYKEDIRKGLASPRWFYFIPGDVIIEKLKTRGKWPLKGR